MTSRTNPEQKLVVWSGGHAIKRVFESGTGVVEPEPQLSKLERWEQDQKKRAEFVADASTPPRFDPDRVDFSNLETILCPAGSQLLKIKQERYDAEEFSNAPLPPGFFDQLDAEIAELETQVPEDERQLINQRVSGPVSAGSRISFRRGKTGKKSPDADLFGPGLKARVWAD